MNAPIVRFVRRFILPRWRLALGLLASMLGGTALAFPVPFLFRYIIDELIPRGSLGGLAWAGSALLGIVWVRAFLSFLRQYLTVVAEETLLRDVETALVRHVLSLPPAFLMDHEVGYLMARIRSDPQVAKAFFSGMLGLVDDAVFLAVGAGLLFWLNWELALVAAAILPLLAYASRGLNARMQALCQGIQEADAWVSRELGEGLSAALAVKLLGLSRWVEGRIDRALERLKEANVRTNTVGAVAGGVLTLIVGSGPVLLLWLGAYMVMGGGLSLGTVVAFVYFIHYLYGPTQSLITTNLDLQRARVAARRIFEILDREPEPREGRPLAVRAGEVRFRGVTFAYPNGTVALKGVSLTVEPGSKVALVGRTGSGKSTLLALLVRLWEPTAGAIYIDGHDIKRVSLASLRAQVILVPQEVVLFSDTVWENLRCGDPGIREEDILRVTRALGAHGFIEGLPKGYGTVVGERGGKLSGGQRQLLALCRAVLRRPKVLLLDEATSAMDSETEARVWRALRELLPDSTIIVAAHRLSTVQSADRIFVLKEGRIVEEGTHEELLSRGGEYRGLFEEQLGVAQGVG